MSITNLKKTVYTIQLIEVSEVGGEVEDFIHVQ